MCFRKKKKSKRNKKLEEYVSESVSEEKFEVKPTKAEIAFQNMQEKMVISYSVKRFSLIMVALIMVS